MFNIYKKKLLYNLKNLYKITKIEIYSINKIEELNRAIYDKKVITKNNNKKNK